MRGGPRATQSPPRASQEPPNKTIFLNVFGPWRKGGAKGGAKTLRKQVFFLGGLQGERVGPMSGPGAARERPNNLREHPKRPKITLYFSMFSVPGERMGYRARPVGLPGCPVGFPKSAQGPKTSRITVFFEWSSKANKCIQERPKNDATGANSVARASQKTL